MFRGENRMAKPIGNANLPQPCMRHRTAHERHVAHAGKMVIADILPASAKEPLVLLAKHRGSDSEFGHPLRSSGLTPASSAALPPRSRSQFFGARQRPL